MSSHGDMPYVPPVVSSDRPPDAPMADYNEVETAVDVFGHDGRFLYAGTLQPRRDGGWNVFHHTDSRHRAQS